MPKSGAERMRACRERKRMLASQKKIKGIPKSKVQLNREYRERKRNLMPSIYNLPIVRHFMDPTTNDDIPSYTINNPTISRQPHMNIPNGNHKNNAAINECSICDKEFPKCELELLDPEQKQILWRAFPGIIMGSMRTCNSCSKFLSRYKSSTQTMLRSSVLWRYMLTKLLVFPKTFIKP